MREDVTYIEDLLNFPFEVMKQIDSLSLYRYRGPYLGSGAFGFCNPASGVTMFYMDCAPVQNVGVAHGDSHSKHVSLNYYLRIKRGAKVYGTSGSYHLLNQGTTIAEQTEYEKKWVELEANGRYEWVNVCIEENTYIRYVDKLCKDFGQEQVDRCWQVLFTNKQHGQIIDFDRREEHIIQEIFHCALPHGNLRKCYLELKVSELLISFFHRVIQCEAVNSSRFDLLSAEEIGELQRVKEYIDAHLYHALDYQKIFSTCRGGSHKIKANFKLMYGLSISRYQQKKRMESLLGKLMNEEGVSVKEIALEAGYSTVQAFSRAFYNEFDIRPSMVRQGNVSPSRMSVKVKT